MYHTPTEYYIYVQANEYTITNTHTVTNTNTHYNIIPNSNIDEYINTNISFVLARLE